MKILEGHKTNKEFREFLEDELCKIKETDEHILYGYGAGVYDSYAYVLRKYDEFHKPVVVPDFVAEWIESPDRDLYDMYVWERPKNVYEWTWGIGDSLENNKYKDLLDAITDGYEVEEETLYYILDSDDIPLLERVDNQIQKTMTRASIHERVSNNSRFKLTEQEIKDYDKRFWAFAAEVENDK